MRIAGGILSGRRIKAPKGDAVRPTQDKVRGAIFSSIAASVPGARVLDLFAGTGALGVEAWSRGAGFVCWVEGDPRVYFILKENVSTLCRPGDAPGEILSIRSDALEFLKKGWTGTPFDLIFADPPYDRQGKEKWLEKTLLALEGNPMFSKKGLLVFEQGLREPVVERKGWQLLRNRRYGQTRSLMYVRSTDDTEA